jgi:hypothetical protein
MDNSNDKQVFTTKHVLSAANGAQRTLERPQRTAEVILLFSKEPFAALILCAFALCRNPLPSIPHSDFRIPHWRGS